MRQALPGGQNGAMDTAALPDDLATCHGMIRELAASLRDAHRQVEQLGHRLDLLLRRLYGPRSERVDPGQLLLFADGAEGDPGVAPTPGSPAEPSAPSATGRAKGHGRKALPSDLPRERRVHDIPPDQRACPECGHDRSPIGEEVSEQLDYRPASLVRRRAREDQGRVPATARRTSPSPTSRPSRSRRGCPGRGCSRRSSRASSPITSRCTGRRGSSPATASSCRARLCAAGWPSRPGCWSRSGRR